MCQADCSRARPAATPTATDGLEDTGVSDDVARGEGGVAEPHDPRLRSAFRAWLEALAVDPEAATAAAMAYESLAPDGRDAWLDALATDAPAVDVPAIALYAPLLGVEADGERRVRIERALAAAPVTPNPPRTLRALQGVDASGETVAAIVVPVYLDFVELLVCRYRPDGGVSSARRGPLLRAADVWAGPSAIREVDETALREVPFAAVVDGLAHALVADRRQGRPPPEPLRTYDFLFALDPAEPWRLPADTATSVDR
jgi:hypothetical protein